jgi:hypothetical protein
MPPEMMAGTAAANVARKKNFTRVSPCEPKPSAAPLRAGAAMKNVTP